MSIDINIPVRHGAQTRVYDEPSTLYTGVRIYNLMPGHVTLQVITNNCPVTRNGKERNAYSLVNLPVNELDAVIGALQMARQEILERMSINEYLQYQK